MFCSFKLNQYKCSFLGEHQTKHDDVTVFIIPHIPMESLRFCHLHGPVVRKRGVPGSNLGRRHAFSSSFCFLSVIRPPPTEKHLRELRLHCVFNDCLQLFLFNVLSSNTLLLISLIIIFINILHVSVHLFTLLCNQLSWYTPRMSSKVGSHKYLILIGLLIKHWIEKNNYFKNTNSLSKWLRNSLLTGSRTFHNDVKRL